MPKGADAAGGAAFIESDSPLVAAKRQGNSGGYCDLPPNAVLCHRLHPASLATLVTPLNYPSPVLDLYHRIWEGPPLGADDFVISADEKTVFRPAAENNRLCLLRRNAPREWSTSTFAGAPGSTWLPGMSTVPRSSVVASSKMALRRWIALLAKS